MKDEHALVDMILSAEAPVIGSNKKSDIATEPQNEEQDPEEQADAETDADEFPQGEAPEDGGAEDEEEESESDDEEEQEEEEEGESEEEPGDTVEFKHPIYADKIKEKFPDREFNTLEDYESATSELIEEYESTIKADQEANEMLVEIFESNPDIKKVVQLMAKGYPAVVAMVKAGFTPQDFELDPDDQNYEDFVLAKAEAKKARENAKKEQERIAKNAETSQSEMRNFQKDKNLNDADFKAFTGWFEQVINKVIDASLDRDLLEKMYQGYTYQSAVKKAQLAGEIKGRNEKIKVEKAKRNGDGLPKLSSASTATKAKSEPRYADPFVAALDQALKSN